MTSQNTFIEKETLPESKRIIICCDGTWQSATSLDPTKGCSSNISRLTRMFANAGKDRNGKAWQQVVYYDAGIGTGDLTESEKTRQGGLGKGLVENILEAYNFIANNYQPGDQLFFFGFSRGAYTVRATAGLVCQLGVLLPTSMPAFIEHYGTYMSTKSSISIPSFDNYPSWVEYMTANPSIAKTSQKDVKVQVVGVFDTVGSLGVPDLGHFWTIRKADPKVYQFYDTDLNAKILHAYQALALDEQRKAFAPAIWKLPPGDTTTELVQCWFPGAHINVGGGSSSNAGPAYTDREQLSLVTFAWMCDRIRPHIALSETALDEQLRQFAKMAALPDPQPKGSIADVASAATAWAKSFIWDPPKKVLKPGYAVGPIDDSHGLQYDLIGFPQERTPGFSNFYEVKGTNDEVVEKLEEGNFTREYIHPCVSWRNEVYKAAEGTGYTPKALKGWERQFVDGKKKGWLWSKVVEGKKSSMWEAELPSFGKDANGREIGLERRLVLGSEVLKPVYEAGQKKLGVS